MTILVDGPNAADIKNLSTAQSRDTTLINGSFVLSSCFSGTKPHSGVSTHNSNLLIISNLSDTKRVILTDCHITSQTIDKYGSSFKFTAENMEIEGI